MIGQTNIWCYSISQPSVILTNTDPAVDSAIRQNSLSKEVFQQHFNSLIEKYPNAKSYLEYLYKSKDYWAHCFIKYKFTDGMIAISRVESVNRCLKNLLHNLNISLYELASEIYKLLDLSEQGKQKNQSMTIQEQSIDELQATLKQMLKFVGPNNVKELWTINIANSLNIKHYLLQNNSYLCSCLFIIQCGIMCRYYFQLMLATSNAKFHIRMLPSQWYSANDTGSDELFLVADKFIQDMPILPNDSPVPYLYFFRQERADFRKENLNTLEQRITYGKLHGVYKKALNKALQNKSKSQQLINLLQDFTDKVDLDDISDSDDESQQSDDNYADKENINTYLQNPKVRKGRGHLPGTKRLKSSYEVVKPKTKQQC
ncbi:hypothetical protein C2G38_2225697 [Gigaspora rosea]|uniref:SWIM-type domain-containing protein n=1 Tax=Gigaspora rosea TaxID=44941 RepID=A0A397U0P9_9GLOM|nr:hypothetical protein C2G38_2225697 [Gigaspora rosea]